MVCIKYYAYAGTQERLIFLTKLITLLIFPIQMNLFVAIESRSSVPWKIISALFFFSASWPHTMEYGRILVPWPGIEPALPALEWDVLATVPSGKSLYSTFFMRPLYTLALRYHIVLKNLYAGQEAIVRTRYGTRDWFKIGKGVCQGCILSHCLFDLYTDYNCEMRSWMKHKLESRLLGEI